MSNNFFPLSAEELIKRINKIPKVKLAMLPTALEYLPNISGELEINLYIKRDDCTALAFGGNKTRHLEFILAKADLPPPTRTPPKLTPTPTKGSLHGKKAALV